MTTEERAEALRPILEWCDAQEVAIEGEQSLKSVTARMLAMKDKYTLLVRFAVTIFWILLLKCARRLKQLRNSTIWS
jgi:hypothetical protein